MTDEKIEKLAVLIDADNAQPSIIDGLLTMLKPVYKGVHLEANQK